MPSIYDAAIRAMMSPTEKALWREYFSLVDSLYQQRIWAYDYEKDGGFLRPDGTRRPPRLVAVVESDADWARLQERVAALEGLKTKWPVQLADQTWGWGRVQVNQAHHAQRLEADKAINLMPAVVAAVGGEQEAKAFLKKLEDAGHGGRIVDGFLEVRAGKDGMTLRQGSGRAFVLRGWSDLGELLGRWSVGVVVIRGCGVEGVQLDARPKKTRKDTKQLIAQWGAYSFYP